MKNATKNARVFRPEKYGMVFCHHCKGLGKFLNEANEIQVCQVCGGFGAVRVNSNDESPPDAGQMIFSFEQP